MGMPNELTLQFLQFMNANENANLDAFLIGTQEIPLVAH